MCHVQLNSVVMETVREITAFVRDIRKQNPSGRMLSIYVLGCVLAVLGSVFGLLELVSQTFTSDPESVPGHRGEKLIFTGLGCEMTRRNSVKRLHAS